MIKIVLIALLLNIAGCVVYPVEFQKGAETMPPPGCDELRKRNGEC